MGAADHHAVQGGRVLGDVDHDGSHFEDRGVVGLQPPLGAVQSLRLGDVALHHRSGNAAEDTGMSDGAEHGLPLQARWGTWADVRFKRDY